MILMSMESSIEYLLTEMEKRGWKQADLARYAGLDSGLINNYISGRRNIGATSALAIAKAFKVAPEIVFRKVGLLPNRDESTAEEEQLLYLFRQMNEDQRRDLLLYADFKLSR